MQSLNHADTREERLHIASLDAAGKAEHKRLKKKEALAKKAERTRLRIANEQVIQKAYEDAVEVLGPDGHDVIPPLAAVATDSSDDEDSDEA